MHDADHARDVPRAHQVQGGPSRVRVTQLILETFNVPSCIVHNSTDGVSHTAPIMQVVTLCHTPSFFWMWPVMIAQSICANTHTPVPLPENEMLLVMSKQKWSCISVDLDTKNHRCRRRTASLLGILFAVKTFSVQEASIGSGSARNCTSTLLPPGHEFKKARFASRHSSFDSVFLPGPTERSTLHVRHVQGPLS